MQENATSAAIIHSAARLSSPNDQNVLSKTTFQDSSRHRSANGLPQPPPPNVPAAYPQSIRCRPLSTALALADHLADTEGRFIAFRNSATLCLRGIETAISLNIHRTVNGQAMRRGQYSRVGVSL